MSSPNVGQKVIHFCAQSQDLNLAKEIMEKCTYMDDAICSLKTLKKGL